MKTNWLVCDGSRGHFCLSISAWSCLCLKFSRNTTQVSIRGEKSGLSSTWSWWNRDIVPWAERDALWWRLWSQSMQRCSDWWSWNPPTPLNRASIFHSWDCVCSVQLALLSLCFPAEWWWREKHPSSSLQIHWKKILEELMKHPFAGIPFCRKSQAVQELSDHLLLLFSLQRLPPVRRRKEGVQKKQSNGIWEASLEICNFANLSPTLSVSVPGNSHYVCYL